MAVNTWGSGISIKPMGKEFSTTRTGTSTRGSGSTIRPMARVPTRTPMEPSTWEIGKMTSKMGWVLRSGSTGNDTRDSIKMALKQEKGY